MMQKVIPRLVPSAAIPAGIAVPGVLLYARINTTV